MIVIACVDDNFGILFNNRRQSRDSKVIDRIYEITKNKNLYIKDFSKELFDSDKVRIVSDFSKIHGEDNFIFTENESIDDFTKIEKIILFFWNRSYPSDFKFKLPPNFKEAKSSEFEGTSHKTITEVEYEKK